ncbi:MAG: CRISPR-associated protein Cas4 [Chloroflexota bacterium]|nr:CRISPR-associated protein Cas4 [Chloroflexota bacterium]
MIWLALGLILAALLVLWLADRWKRATGLPEGRVVSSDMGRWQPESRVLYDHRLDLAGKPDYIVEHDGVPVPIEVKSGRTPNQPYQSHILQLAAYCYLVEATSGKRPPYGILRYPQNTFKVPYTLDLREELLATLAEIRQAESRPSPMDRLHHSPARCAACGFRSVCDQRLG